MANGLFFQTDTRPSEQPGIRFHRTLAVMLLISSVFIGYGYRLAQLQLVQGRYHRYRAELNRIRQIPVASERGNILDRKGRVLAANRLSRSVYLWPREQTPEQWQDSIPRLAALLNLPATEILEKLEQSGYRSALPIRIRRDLKSEEFVALEESMPMLPGVEVRAESNRDYPHGSLASHVLGYIGEATLDELKAKPEYPMGMVVGKMGIERFVNDQLEGVWGGRLVEVDALGQELRELGLRPSKAGSAVQLTLDLDLQKAAERALGNRRGAVVVLDVKTGGVLAMASGPTFDPNVFTRRVTDSEWEYLQSQENPFLNRALQGYPPGSTFKIVTSAAGMESGKFSPNSTLMTSAYITVGGIQFNEHSGSYGVIGFREALAYSSNTFFYQVGMQAGVSQVSKWAKNLGIGKTTDLSLLGLEGGNYGMVPTEEEKLVLFGEPWYAGDTVSMSIGQGLVLASPLELAVMTASIANGGMRVKPHLLASQTNTPATKPEPTGAAPETIKAIQSGLVAVVQQGTARRLNDGSIPLTAGKTGTSEVVGQPSHALYVAYGPAVNPEIAIAVVVENGGFGGVNAVPVAQEIFNTFFKK
ncbi:penicillin-binding protein 2 [Desertifilum sp. FACHB-1129]|uniref:Penicillin-binding protein 2 n=1 Tax=Desertifilum tharense IPPAS B-1220 TaxID=1781255 RepID=A0A1E5QKD5_9CYAN|nr:MULTISPECIES: penicillin-binding protein 2 [Desertifilum]MDA0209771.1 penicillin-binding protein 2 [Cyanobacteria bacterium FC1]MBD2310738.1 penicillin-binding protein 2 [Desertifilum sp. FACHB-1129]MBD2320775.1 penicillin-binding protein 2 [Desertifilum sp. FACHB-866]MBD2330903.1 penicillin-binding protein 2 [Desertifilum sp. FACHB-868]OEJ75156.1 penicillin-binding protein 2 [Desertifilum tharense IPPAS B-1220]